MAKLLSLLVAAAIWFLIKAHLAEQAPYPQDPNPPPRAIPVREPVPR